MQRANELREEAEAFDRAAAFLTHQAMAKRRIADQIELIDNGAEGRGGGSNPLPRHLDGTRGGSA